MLLNKVDFDLTKKKQNKILGSIIDLNDEIEFNELNKEHIRKIESKILSFYHDNNAAGLTKLLIIFIQKWPDYNNCPINANIIKKIFESIHIYG